MAGAQSVALRFFRALHARDFSTAGDCLRDDLSFQGPFETFTKAAPYLEAVKGLYSGVRSVDIKKVFVDGDEVCVFYEMTTNTVSGALICEWMRVAGDKIAAVRAVFDARPFAAMFDRA
jgi:hypothetical protein